MEDKNKEEIDIAQAFNNYKDEHLDSENLPEGVKVYRIKVAKTFLKAAVLFSIYTDLTRHLLEENVLNFLIEDSQVILFHLFMSRISSSLAKPPN